MAVAHDTATESHTASTGSASQASFDTSVTPSASWKGILVFTFVNANADNALSVKIDPAGANVDVPAVTGGRAVDTATEAGDCKAWFLGSGLPAGGSALTIRVNRTNNANVMYAVVITVTAATDTETFNPVVQNENRALAQEYVEDGGYPGINAVRYAGVNSGLATHPPAGANSTELHFFPATAGTRSISTVRETTAGVGARLVGFAAATDDVAFVGIAIREKVYERADITCDLCIMGDTGHADGTTMTTAIYKGMGFSPDFPVTFDGVAAGQTINADQSDRPKAPISVRNCGIAAKTHAYRSYRLDNTVALRSSNFDVSALVLHKCVAFGYYRTTLTSGGAAGLYDVVRFSGLLAEAVIMQLDIGTNGPGFALNIETVQGGTTHSAFIAITTNTPYWFNILWDADTHVPKLAVWDLTTGKLLGSVTSTQTTFATSGEIATIELGNSEAGTQTGTPFTWLQVYVDYTAALFSVPPPFGAMPPFNDFARPRFTRPRRKVA